MPIGAIVLSSRERRVSSWARMPKGKGERGKDNEAYLSCAG